MELANDFLSWAWARHHNPLSWYIRPIMLIPFCFFAYRQSAKGIVLTLVALATSMFWFPAPNPPSEEAIHFLEMEKEYLTSDWTFGKILMGLIVPFGFTLLGIAFWKRSLFYGALVANLMVISKVIWSTVNDAENSVGTIYLPTIVGVLLFNSLFYYLAKGKKQEIS
ncbi:hypothetical protein DLM76_02575 [Leptospira yasudae]|uniref:ABC transporter permease n=1 Tax=Leptospira yasudae TaxID=2202201 RepID=A0ABX9M6P6_9LEPT|nr:hypothetical protein [Leptospira yasudae]RHX81588.1 hypothetical protein DLM77_05775 [Leptospira yasudae]RHX95876.1 hypothetical protein DLM76_02575 [Leptospira yasudae]TGK29684.1 hypothetical protein EHQ05_01590 [Leptospira yasudae]TGM07690.1 hypothetical protein EHQ86_06425 [Leptospira yasudae]